MEQHSGEIRYQLAKVLGAEMFKASPTSSRLLEHLVGEYLEGRSDRLKGYSIGVDVFDRGEDFDAGTDSIVRVQMGRLRRLLAEYYASDEGRNDRVRFEFPKGSYVPVINMVESAHSAPGPLAAVAGFWRVGRRKYYGLVALLLLVLVGIGGAVFYDRLLPRPERMEPRLFVAQFNVIDGSSDTRLIAKGLQHDLIALLSQYPNIEILGYETVAGEGGGGQKISNWHGADYLLSGSVATADGTIKVSSELVSVRKGTVLWSNMDSFAYSNAGDVLQSQSEIALKVGSTLGQPDGVIQQASKALIAESKGVSFANYACILAAYDYKRQKAEKDHLKIRKCLEKATRDNPNYSSAWSMLSWIYGDEHRYGFNRQAGGSGAVRALKAAEKGVATNPFSATAHQYLAIAQFYLGQDQKARQSMATAQRLSPNSSEILADAGWQNALAGNSDDARTYFDEALQLNPDPPTWYWGGLAIDAIRNDDADRAKRFAELYSGDGVLSLYVKAAAARLNGDDRRADLMLASASKSFPGGNQRDNDFIRHNRLDARLTRWIFGE